MNAPVDRAALAAASLDDKYTLERGRVFLTGTQALIRLMMLQRERDLRAGLNTAGFVSGHRGPPLGGLDYLPGWAALRLVRLRVPLDRRGDVEVAGDALCGRRMIKHFPKGRYDGVYLR